MDAGLPAKVEAVREGRAIVQDEGSQLVVEALLAVPVSNSFSVPKCSEA